MKKQHKRLQLKPITIRILDISSERVAGGTDGVKARSTEQVYCSGTCTCTNQSVWPCVY